MRQTVTPKRQQHRRKAMTPRLSDWYWLVSISRRRKESLESIMDKILSHFRDLAEEERHALLERPAPRPDAALMAEAH
jgi:hypothetical protein